MDPEKYFGGHNLKNTGKKQQAWYVRKYAIWIGNFTLSPVAYITVDFKKVVSDPCHAGSTLVKKENAPREKRGYRNSPKT